MFINLENKTWPFILHSPNYSLIFEKYYKFILKNNKNYKKPNDLDIITFNHSFKKGMLEKQLEKFSLEHHVLGRGIKNWQNKLKINLILNFLKKNNKKYILSLDNYDVIINKNLENIIELFINQEYKILFNATCNIWPPTNTKFKCDILNINSNNIFKYLNAGVWIAYKEYAIQIFEEAKKLINKINLPGYEFSEQIILKHTLNNFSEFNIDNKCIFFQIFHEEECKNIIKNMIKL